MIFLHFFLLFAIQLTLYKESNFQYSQNNELILERIKRGRDALDEILKAKKKAEQEYKKRKKKGRNEDTDPQNIYVKEIKCYDYVLDQLNNLNTYNCNDINENNKSLLALAKTKCIFVKSTRDFPEESSGCILNPKNLTKFQLYLYNNNLLKKFDKPNFIKSLTPEVLNEIEKITNPCTNVEDENMSFFSNESKKLSDKPDIANNISNDVVTNRRISAEEIELNKKLCENLKYKIITHCTGKKQMSDIAFQIYHSELNHIDDICFYIQSIEWNKRTEVNINQLSDTSLHITRQLSKNLENMKLIENAQTKQIENTNKFDHFLKSLKSDFSDLMQLLIKIKKHHDSLTRFLRGFQMAVCYLLVLIFVLIVTSKNQTSNGRKLLFTYVILCYLTEYAFRNMFNFVSAYVMNLNPFIPKYTIKGIRYGYIMAGVRTLVNTILTYKEPMRKIEEQLIDIKKIVENNQSNVIVNQEPENISENLENLKNALDCETANILHMWSSYNDYLDSYYSDDSDYVLSSQSLSELSSSDVSLVSEETPSEKCENIKLNELSIGERIEYLHREKRPIRFHCIPSPHNLLAFMESPASFTETIAHNHEKLMQLREKRIVDMSKKNKKGSTRKKRSNKNTDDNDETIPLENDEQNETCDLYELSSSKSSKYEEKCEKEELNKFYSISSQIYDE